MTPVAILAIIVFAVVQAATITLPVTQDFAIVNQDRVRSVIARNDKISLFNNGILSSISYFGVDTQPIISQAEITSTSPLASMIESAQLIFNNVTMLSAQIGAINLHISALNPGQMWSEDTVTLETTPTIQGSLGNIDFSKEKPSLDVTNQFIQALSDPYQGALFGFHIPMPGGPLEVASHRADPNSIVVEVIYSPIVGPGATSPHQSTTSTTGIPTTTSTTQAPSSYCWSCGPGWTHWYNVQGVAQPEDPCACVRDPATSTSSPGVPATPSTTTRAPSTASPGAPATSSTTTGAPASGTTTTTTGSPAAPSTSGAPGSSSTTVALTTTAGPTGSERQNSAAKSGFSALVVFVLLALYL